MSKSPKLAVLVFTGIRLSCFAKTSSAEQVQAILVNGCQTATAYGSTCSVNIPWPAAFLNTNYIVTCSATGASAAASSDRYSASFDINVPFADHTTTNSTIVIRNLDNGAGIVIPQVQCIGVLP